MTNKNLEIICGIKSACPYYQKKSLCAFCNAMEYLNAQ